MKSTLFAFLLLSLSPAPAFAADIVINEFSPQSSPEWVELYNTTDSQITLVDWKIKDEANSPKDLADVCIPSHGYYTYETSNWLNNSGGDSISILDKDGNIIDAITYGNTGNTVPSTPNSSESASRVPDGNSTWQIGSQTRQDTSTACAPDPTPTPNPSPSPSPTPSPTPTPASSPTPTPVKSSSPSPKPTPKSSPNPSSQAPTVLGETSDISSSPSPSASPEAESGSLSKTKAAALITGAGAILIALSFGFYLWYSKLLGQEKAQEVIEVDQTDKSIS